MHNQILMCEGDRLANPAKQVQPLGCIEFVFITVPLDVYALDVLENKVWQAICSRASIDQARNVWVIEIGQYLPFHHKAPDDRVGIHAALDDF